MALATELSSFYDNLRKNAPPSIISTVESATNGFAASFDHDGAIQAGDRFPAFQLRSVNGEDVDSAKLLAQGPILVSFYRGGWCPFCNMQLRSWQKYIPQLHEAGVTLVTISPALVEESRSRSQRMELDFLMLSDADNELARRLGIIFAQPESMRPILEGNPDFTAGKSLEVPVPATILVDQKGVVRNAFVNPDYRKRIEPTTALNWIEDMKKKP